MSDFHDEVMHSEYERLCGVMERYHRINPEHHVSRDERWMAWVTNEWNGMGHDWVGCIARWLDTPLWNQDEMFADAREELERMRREMR